MKNTKPYNHYKPSGIAWLGEIPQHWEVRKLKYNADVVLGKMLCNENKGSYLLKPYLKSKNIQWLKVNVLNVEEMWFSQKELDQYRIKKGDLVLSEGGEVGKTCIWNNELDECYIQNSAHKVTFNDDNVSKFFLFLFFTYGKKGGFESIVNRVSIGHLTREKLSHIKCVTPPLSEQTTIARFLNYKLNKIDRFILKKKKLIQLLNEQKAAIINDAVTKGLDSSVKMKDSGVEWLGGIPEHWEVKKLKGITSIISKGTTPNTIGKTTMDSGEVRFLKAENIKLNNQMSFEPVNYIDKETDEILKRSQLKENDILFVIAGATIGKVAILNKKYLPCNRLY